MNKLLLILGLALCIVSCDSSSDPNGNPRMGLPTEYFSYAVGDSMVYEIDGFFETTEPFIDTYVVHVADTRVIDGETWQLHATRGYKYQPSEDSVLYRVVGSQVFRRDIVNGGRYTVPYLYLDFEAPFSDTTQVFPLMKVKDTTGVRVPAGTFPNATIMRAGKIWKYTHIYSAGIGLIYIDMGRLVYKSRLINASVGGRQYP